MEEAPTPNYLKENKNNKNKDDSESFEFCWQNPKNPDSLFQIFIKKFNDYIEIICMDILDESNQNTKYSSKFNSKSLQEIMGERSINKAYQILKDITPNNALIELKDNIIILSINSSSIKEKFLLYKAIDINECLTLINQLREENNNLRNELNEFKNNFKIICQYNLLDINSPFKLKDIFEQIKSAHKTRLINKEEELVIINKGIKHLLNKSICSMKILYCSETNGEDPDKFNEKYNEILDYAIIIIKTKDEKKFGIFCNKKNDAFNNQNLNPFINLYNQIMEDNHLNEKMRFQNYYMDNINLNNDYIDIFNSNSISNKHFVFSLDDLSVYYQINIIYSPNIFVFELKKLNLNYYSNESTSFPNISIKLSKQFQTLCGNENYNMNIPQNINTSNFKLSGGNQFNIRKYELYSIDLE